MDKAEKPKASVAEIAARVDMATQDYNSARMAAATARNVETEALNKLNQVQKELDDAYTRLRKDANANTDWGKLNR